VGGITNFRFGTVVTRYIEAFPSTRYDPPVRVLRISLAVLAIAVLIVVLLFLADVFFLGSMHGGSNRP
jgi:hypothetical protein